MERKAERLLWPRCHPKPWDEGVCLHGASDYIYTSEDPNTYNIGYCLAANVSDVGSGFCIAVPGSIASCSSCAAKTCAAEGKNCGNISDGCGGVLDCGACAGATPYCSNDQTTCLAENDCPTAVCGDGRSLVCGSTDFTANSSLTLDISNADAYEAATTYQAVKIGNQCWMDKNLNIGFKDITHAMDSANPAVGITRYCYNDSSDNCTSAGALYTWPMAMYLLSSYDSSSFNGYTGSGATAKRQGICPAGWHIPSDREWAILEDYLDVNNIPPIGDGATCASDNWGYNADLSCDLTPDAYNTGEMYCTKNGNGCGAKVLPGGGSGLNIPFAGAAQHGGMFQFSGFGDADYLWSSSQNANANKVWVRHISDGSYIRDPRYKSRGYSLRCLKD